MPVKVICVDDSRTIRFVIVRALSNYDCTIFEAGDGEEAFAIALREKPDIILLDMSMPVLDGVGMLAKLKETESLKRTPVIMMSAESAREKVLAVAGLGVNDYLVKPFRMNHLIAKVNQIVPLTMKPSATSETTIKPGL